MEAIQTTTRQISERKVAEELLSQYAEYDKTGKECVSEKKAIEVTLLELAENHSEWFDGKTAQFENGKLKYAATSTVIIPKDFDMAAFKRKYPHLVRVKEDLQSSKVRPYLDDAKFMEKTGLSIESTDKFRVEV